MDGGPVAADKLWFDDGERRLSFGRLLAEGLKAQAMKQGELARKLGTTQSSVSGWINGRYEPAAATVFAIERALDMDPGTLSRPLGYLPVEPASRPVSVEGAIAQSTLLDEDQKAALRAMYRLLVRGSDPPAASTEGRHSRPAAPNRTPLAGSATTAPRHRSVAGGG